MVHPTIRRRLRTFVPSFIRKLESVRRLQASAARCESTSEAVDLVTPGDWVGSTQKPGEIRRLLEIVEVTGCKRLCEIGASRGGTLFLLSRAARKDARLLSIDIAFGLTERLAYPRLAQAAQRITCLRGNSHDERTVSFVRRWLDGGSLDFLLIDGDHSGAGVRNDFRMYAPLVRAGGLIALHDIVPDYRSRYGTPTAANVGDVPAFWAELKHAYPGAREFVDDPDQDGFGIGLITWDGEASVSAP